MSKQEMTGKDETEMKRIAQELLLEASGQVDDPHEAAETETQRNIRLAREAMETSSGGTSPTPSSQEPAAASVAVKKKTTKKKTIAKKKTSKKAPAAKKPPKPPVDIPGAKTNVQAIVESICAQLKVQRRSDGNYSDSMRNAAISTVRQLDTPHPATLRPEVASAFWERYYKLISDRDHMAKVAEWRVENDRLATSVAVFKQHVRLCAAKALFEILEG